MLQQVIDHGARSLQLLFTGNSPTFERDNHRRALAGEPRILARRPLPSSQWKHSPRRINTLAVGASARDYLEIGVARGFTLQNVRVNARVGVDPSPRFNVARLPHAVTFHAVTSDAYFASLAPSVTFDLAFVDGLHTFEQTWTDLVNVFAHMPVGAVLIDDTVPTDEVAALRDQDECLDRRRAVGSTDRRWMGDVWKVVVCLERYVPELEFRTIIGSGNEQTLVWRRQPGTPVSTVTPQELASVASLGYTEVMGAGVPAAFRPTTEAEAIRECLSVVTRRP